MKSEKKETWQKGPLNPRNLVKENDDDDYGDDDNDDDDDGDEEESPKLCS
jgi:hypothetical protein